MIYPWQQQQYQQLLTQFQQVNNGCNVVQIAEQLLQDPLVTSDLMTEAP